MLLDRGLLVQEGSVYRPVGEIGSLEVPETLHALIAARLDGLTAEERRLLQDGAVLGKTFTQDGLIALSSDAEADLEPLLSALVRKEVLSRQADPRSPEHGQYGFLQDLVRHVAYETLSKRDRRAKHLAAAAHLSANLAEDEVVEVLAAHYLSAYRAAPEAEDALEIKGWARDALAQAGERAASLGAAAEAQRYFEQAAELSEATLVEAALTARAGQMAVRADEQVQARKLLNHAHDAYEAGGEIRSAALVSARLAELDFVEGHAQQAVARLEPALEALTGGEPDEVVAAVAAQLGRFLVLSDEGDRAVPILEQALGFAETLDLPETLAEALNSKAINLLRADRLYEGRVLLEAAVSLALEHDLHHAALRALNNLTVVLGSADRDVESLATIERGLELARRVGDRSWESNLLGFVVGVLTELDRWDEALARAAEVEERANTSFTQSFLLIPIRIHAERGDVDQARDVLARNSAVAQSEAGQDVAHYALAEARVLRAEGKPAEALEVAERAVALRSELGITLYPVKFSVFEALEAAFALQDFSKARGLLAIVDGLRPGQLTPLLKAQQARFRARLAAQSGGADPARDFAAAESIFRALDMPFRLAVTQLEHAEWLTRNERDAEAEPLLADARETFERLKSRPWLERLDRIETGRQSVLAERS